LPGYVLANAQPIDKNDQIVDASSSDRVARMCLKIPMIQGRDLDDVVIESRDGEEWVRVGSSLFRPMQNVLAFTVGSHSVRIGAEGLAEWRRLPPGGVVTISGATGWKVYDQEFVATKSGSDDGATSLPGHGNAAYLLLFGLAGAEIRLTVA
jgi:hypothetical protein